MKKIILISTLFVAALATSCTREHICECVSVDFNGNATSTKTSITATKKKAIEKCDLNDTDPLIGASSDCEITSL